MLKVNEIHPEVKKVLDSLEIKESNLFNHSSDLFIGCETGYIADAIINSGVWRGMSSKFRPNKGSDMDHFTLAVEIPFAYTGYFIEKKHNL